MQEFIDSHRMVCIGLLLAASLAVADDAQQPSFAEADLEFFEKEVRPLLVARCYECHSAKSKIVQGNLRVDSRDALLKGGDTGPAIVTADAKKSLFGDAINYGDTYQMPPKTKLPAAADQWPARDGTKTPDAVAPALAGI